MKLSRKLWPQPLCLLPLSHQLLKIAKLINCESWQIRTLLKFKTETWGQEISILYYLEYIITDRLAGIRFLPATKWDSQIMSCQPSCLWWHDMPFGKGRAVRCDTTWHPSAFWCCSMPWWTEEMRSGQSPRRMGGKLFWNSDYLVVPGQNTTISWASVSTQHGASQHFQENLGCWKRVCLLSTENTPRWGKPEDKLESLHWFHKVETLVRKHGLWCL